MSPKILNKIGAQRNQANGCRGVSKSWFNGVLIPRFLAHFRAPLGTPGEYFGEHLGARVSKWSVYVDFYGVCFVDQFSDLF